MLTNTNRSAQRYTSCEPTRLAFAHGPVLLLSCSFFLSFSPGTGTDTHSPTRACYYLSGIKFLLLTTPSHPSPLTVLQNVYRVYANHLKDPFYTVEMPIARSDAFDAQMTAVCRGSGPTGAGGGGGGAIGSGSGLSLVGSLGAGAGVGGGGGGGSSSSTVNS